MLFCLTCLVEESQILSFVMWSVVTGIAMTVTGISYRSYLRKKGNRFHAP